MVKVEAMENVRVVMEKKSIQKLARRRKKRMVAVREGG